MSIQLNLDMKVSNLETVSDNSFSDKAVDLLKSGLKSDLNSFGEAAKRDVAIGSQVNLGSPSENLLTAEHLQPSSFNPSLVGSGILYTKWNGYSSVNWSEENPTLPSNWTEDSILHSGVTNTSTNVIMPSIGRWFFIQFKFEYVLSGTFSSATFNSLGYPYILVDGNKLRAAVKYSNFSRTNYYPSETNSYWVPYGRTYLGLCQESDRKLRVGLPNSLGLQSFSKSLASNSSNLFRFKVKVYKL